jgi:hypothetical protein
METSLATLKSFSACHLTLGPLPATVTGLQG